MPSKFLGTALFCGVLALTGCTTRFVDYTIISTKNIDLSKAATFQRSTTRTEGVDKAYIIIIIPTGVPNLKEAIDRAIESVPGAVALLDGVVSSGSFYIPYIYGESNFTVEGTALIDPALSSRHAETTTPYLVAALDKSGKVGSLNYVTKTEYEAVKGKISPGSPVKH